jgi:hypothetical protein
VSEAKDATGVTENTFDLMEFIETGTVARREVVIYTDHEAAAKCADLQKRIDELTDDDDRDRAPKDGPLSGDGGGDELAALEAEAEQWLERLQASRMVWTVRALSQTEVEKSFDVVPVPKMPAPPPDNAPDKLRDRWMERVAKYHQDDEKAKQERTLVLIATALQSVETPKGIVGSVDVDTLRALRDKPHGKSWIDKLYTAVNEASSEDVAPPVPTSPGRSTSTRG